MDTLDFLNAGQPAPEDAPVTEAPAADAPNDAVATPEVVDAPVVPDQQQVAPQVAEKPSIPDGYIPIGVMLDTRDQLKAERDRAKALEEQLRQFQQPAPTPDDEQYADFRFSQTEQAVLSTKLDISEEMTREKFGDETVDAVKDWAVKRFAEDPSFHQQVLSQRNPYGFAVAQYQRSQALDKLGAAADPSKIEAFLAWQAAQQAGTQPVATAPAAAAIPQETPAIPPRSIASAPGAGGGAAHVPTGPGEGYAAVFGQGT